MADIYERQGRYQEALDTYGQSLEIERIAADLNNMANVYKKQGRYEEALAMCTEALEIYREAKGERHPDVAMSLNNMVEV